MKSIKEIKEGLRIKSQYKHLYPKMYHGDLVGQGTSMPEKGKKKHRAVAPKGKTHRPTWAEPHHLEEHMLRTYSMNPDVDRMNHVFDQVTSKYYGNQQVFVNAVRAVLNFWGIQLPELDCEQHIQGPHSAVAAFDLHFGPGHDINRETETIPQDFEYTFQIECMSPQGTSPELYLYMCGDRVDIDGDAEVDPVGEVWECYAQVVTPEELADLVDDGPPARDFPHPNGDIMSGETKYQKQVRHAGVTGSPGEKTTYKD